MGSGDVAHVDPPQHRSSGRVVDEGGHLDVLGQRDVRPDPALG